MSKGILSIRLLTVALRNDFYRVHSSTNGHDFCYCTAWWVEKWEGWSERTADENYALREELFASDRMDGYLLYLDEHPVGWVQACGRDWLTKLTKQFRRKSERKCASITCWFFVPQIRKKGYAHQYLQLILDDLAQRGYQAVEVFPVLWEQPVNEEDEWNGPLSLYTKAGFHLERRHDRYPVYRVSLQNRIKSDT